VSRRVLSEDATAVLEAVLERVIPSDAHGPGAREARVSRYVARRLEGPYRAHLETYAVGLARLDADALATHGARFADLAPDRQDALLKAEELRHGFFALVVTHAMEGMFGDPRHGGNADRTGWDLIGYPGPSLVWTEQDQQLGPA
jgi:gluconate 2-dehydrogenase gamma chain